MRLDNARPIRGVVRQELPAQRNQTLVADWLLSVRAVQSTSRRNTGRSDPLGGAAVTEGMDPMKGKFDLIAFDFDGTIADSLECIVRSMQRAFTDAGYAEPSREAIRVQIGRPLERCMPDLVGAPLTDSDLSALVARYRVLYAEAARQNLRLFPGIGELLQQLSAGPARMGIVTGKKSTVAIENCDQLGVRSHFEAVVGSEHTTLHKPNAEPLLELVRQMKADRESRIVVVGDSILDISMGRAAGVPTIGVTWGANTGDELRDIGSDFVVDSVAELTELLLTPMAS